MSADESPQMSKPTEPVLCKMGCGFFGSGATGGCCSKCWRENMKKQEVAAAAAPPAEPEPMEGVVTTTVSPAPASSTSAESATTASPAPTTTAPKKKKKKASYKSLMAGMMQASPERDVEKEKEELRKVTGGGAFSKIDKI